jgi:4-oxalocrotonate tautomerase
MPHVIVKLYPGRSERQKAQLAEAIVKDVVAIAKVGDDAVSVAIEEVKPGHWADQVYRSDILNSYPRNQDITHWNSATIDERESG